MQTDPNTRIFITPRKFLLEKFLDMLIGTGPMCDFLYASNIRKLSGHLSKGNKKERLMRTYPVEIRVRASAMPTLDSAVLLREKV